MLDSESKVFVASKVPSGMALTVWAPNTNESNTEMIYQNYDTTVSWNTPQIQRNVSFTWTTRVELTSIAVADRNGEFPRVAIAVNFDTVFRVFVFNSTSLTH